MTALWALTAVLLAFDAGIIVATRVRVARNRANPHRFVDGPVRDCDDPRCPIHGEPAAVVTARRCTVT